MTADFTALISIFFYSLSNHCLYPSMVAFSFFTAETQLGSCAHRKIHTNTENMSCYKATHDGLYRLNVNSSLVMNKPGASCKEQ